MGRITATIPDNLEQTLRLKVVERLGGKHGDVAKAIEEAINKWIID